MDFWKESMINRLSNLNNRNRSAAKISQVLCSTEQPLTRGSVLDVQQVNVETMVSPIACGLMSCFPNSNKEAPFQSGFSKFLKIKSS